MRISTYIIDKYTLGITSSFVYYMNDNHVKPHLVLYESCHWVYGTKYLVLQQKRKKKHVNGKTQFTCFNSIETEDCFIPSSLNIFL